MVIGATRRSKDPAQLTPYEAKLVELRNKGLTYRQMSEALDGTSELKSISSRFKVIREKLALQEELKKYENEE